MFRVIRSTLQAVDIDENLEDAFEDAINAALAARAEVRETYSTDGIGQKDCHIALLPYVDPTGARRWVVLHEDPAESDWQDTDDLDEGIAYYEKAVRETTACFVPDYDEEGEELPVWDETDVEGVPAREVGDGGAGNALAYQTAAQWAHEEFTAAEKAYRAATRRRDASFAEMAESWGRGGKAILASQVGLKEPTVKRIADRGQKVLKTRTVRLYEDNTERLFLHRLSDATAWDLGAPPEAGKFAADAAAWVGGGWEPSESDGQSPVPAAELKGMEHIATWRPRGVQVIGGRAGSAAGAAGRAYLGLR